MMREIKQVRIWTDRGANDNCNTLRTNLHPKRVLILGLIQSPQWQQQPPGRTSALKPFTNFTVPVALDYKAGHRLAFTVFSYKRHKNSKPTLQRITSELHLYYSKKDVSQFLVHLVLVDHYLLYSVQLFGGSNLHENIFALEY